MFAETVRATVPIAAAAIGGSVSERSGVPHIALEGALLVGGFFAVAVHVATGSAAFGLVGGTVAAAIFGLVHATLSTSLGVHPIVSGIALNLAATAGTRFGLRALYASSSNSPTVTGFHLFEGAGGTRLVLRALFEPTTVLVVLFGIVFTLGLERTRFGLHVRAVGDDPEAARAAAVPVARTRILAVTFGTALAGLGGAALAFDQHQFQAGMSGGRGFIALAAVVLGGWRPHVAVLACVLFASLDAVSIVLQGAVKLPTELTATLPYVVTLASLALVRVKDRAPRALSS